MEFGADHAADHAGDDAADTAERTATRPAASTLAVTSPAVTVPAEPPAGPRHLSPSSADTYQRCPRRWRFRYVDKLPDPPTEAALSGTFAHRVLELLLQEAPEQRTIDRAKALARQCWPALESDPAYRTLGLDPAAGRAFRWRAWQAIEGLWLLEDPRQVEVAATEHQVVAQLGGVPFRGIVDRLDRAVDGLVVTDYKSGRAPGARFADERLTQVLLYAAAVEATVGERPVAVRLLYLGQRTVERPVADAALAEVTEGLTATWSAVQADVVADRFDPRPGPLCAWCPYADRCPEGLAELRQRDAMGALDPRAPAAIHVA